MRRVARGALLGFAGCAGVALAWVGCGGAAFTQAPAEDGGASDAAGGADATGSDASGTNEGGAPADGSTTGGNDGSSGSTDGGDGAAGQGSDASDAATGGDAGDGGPASFSCAATTSATVIWCSDFDEQADPPWGWAQDPTFGSGSIAVDTTDRLSPPNAFAASNTTFLTGSVSLASLGQQLSNVNAGRIEYSFWVFVKEYDSIDNPLIPIGQLTIDPGGSSLSLELAFQSGSLNLVQIYAGTDGGQQMPSIGVGAMATGAWVEVDLLLDRSAASWKVSVSLDGVSNLTTTTPTSPASANIEVDLGILEVAAPTTANEVVFDNVLVRAY
jgi:hypothetical protein